MKNKDILKRSIISAIVVFLCGIVIFFIRDRLFGKYTFMHSDMAAQYSSIAKLFLRQLFIDHNIIYSWNVSLGSDTIPLYAFYSCFSPFTLIYALDFNIDLLSFFVTFGKLSLAAFAFNWFVSKYIKLDNKLSIMLSVLYSMCGFTMAYYSNMIWFDGMYMLPVIIALVIDLLNNKKNSIFLSLAYAYIFVVNFYSGYIIGIFSAIVFILLIFRKKEKNIKDIFKYIFKFIFVGTTAICLSAPILYPTARAFLGSRTDDSSAFAGLYLNIFDIYNQLFVGQVASKEIGHFPYVYCGIISLILLVMFYLNKKITRLDKLLLSVLFCVYIISCFVPGLYLLMHCFDTPDSYNFRFSYLIVFVILCAAGMCLANIQGVKKKYIIVISSLCFVVFLIYSVIQVKIYDFISNISGKYILINSIFMFIYALLLIFYLSKDKKKIFEFIIIAISIVEISINGLSYEVINRKCMSEETDLYFFYNNQIKDAIETLKTEDDSWYRVYSPNSLYCNDSMKYDYNTLGVFSSYQNQSLRKTLGRLGYVASALSHRDMGSTEITRMMMGEKYNIVSSGWNEKLDKAYYEEFDYYLPIGFMVDEGVVACSLVDDKNPFNNQNKLLSSMLGEDIKYFYNTGENISIDYYNAEIVDGEEYPTFQLIDNSEMGYVLFDDSSKETKYAYFSTPYVMEASDSALVTNSDMQIGPLIMDSFLLSPHIVKTAENDSEIYIVMGGDRLPWASFEKAYFYGTNKDIINYIYSKLNNHKLEVIEIKDGYVKGNISVDKEDILFTSIPYEEGWKVYVDGKETEKISLVDDAFLGVKITQGNHEVLMKYYDNNITIGLVMLFVGFVFSGCVIFYDVKKGMIIGKANG